MKCPQHADWDLLAMEAVDEAQAEVLRIHAESCSACRAEFLAARRAHVDRLRRYEALDRDHERRRDELMAALPDSVPAAAQESRVLHRIGDFVMSINRTTPRRIAAVLVPAACVAIAAVLLLSPGTQKSAFAAAIERLRQAKTIVAHFEAYMNDGTKPMQSGTLYLSDEYGMRFDASMDVTAFASATGLPDSAATAADASFSGMAVTHRTGGPVVLVHSGLKFAVRMHTPDGKLSGWSGGFDQSSPDQFLSSLRRMKGEADAHLGRSQIDGRAVDGFEVSARKLGMEFIGRNPRDGEAPSGHARLWVDARSHLPVRMEVEIETEAPPLGAIKVRAVYDHFEFDRTLEEALFDAKIPDGARVFDVNVPAPSEETLISALKLFADTIGRYPSTLDPGRISAELMVGLVSKGGFKLDPSDPAAVFSAELLENTMRVAMASAFAQQLARDGFEPEYFGDFVRPEDADEVLLRWKLADGRWRVIDGGLRAETIAP